MCCWNWAWECSFSNRNQIMSPLLKTLHLLSATVRIKSKHLTTPYLLTLRPYMIWLQFPVYFLYFVPLLIVFQPHLPSCVTQLSSVHLPSGLCICPSLSLVLLFPQTFLAVGSFFFWIFAFYLFIYLFIYLFKHLYWSIIALQWCVSFCFITKWISYTYTYVPICLPSCVSLPPTSISHPSRWSQSTKLISLCYAAASH